jgi:hypothetical protein
VIFNSINMLNPLARDLHWCFPVGRRRRNHSSGELA